MGRPRKRPLLTYICAYCSTSFTRVADARRPDAKPFCSNSCRYASYKGTGNHVDDSWKPKAAATYHERDRKPWNTGLTKETSESVAKIARSKTGVSIQSGRKGKRYSTKTDEERRTAKLFYKCADWIEASAACLARDSNVCQHCGATKRRLNAHHRIPYAVCHHNQLDNLVTLCVPCHRKAEHGLIVV